MPHLPKLLQSDSDVTVKFGFHGIHQVAVSAYKHGDTSKLFYIRDLSVKNATECYQLLIYILCITLFVTSLIAVIQALLWEKLSADDQIIIKNLKRRRDGH